MTDKPLPNGWKSVCGAKTRSGKPCAKPPCAGRTRCRLHGGATPVGMASPHYKHGRKSKYMDALPMGSTTTVFIPACVADSTDPEGLVYIQQRLRSIDARLKHIAKRRGEAKSKQWKEAVELVCKKTGITDRQTQRDLLQLPVQLPDVPLDLLISDLLTTADRLVKNKATKEASAVFEMLADQYRKGIR